MVNFDYDPLAMDSSAALWSKLVAIMRTLRGENGCPWDKAQTHDSIRQNLVEECYEALEGIDLGDDALLCEELGDVMLQVVFHAQIAAEDGRFTIEDVLRCITNKLVERHEHVFGTVKAGNEEEALESWNRVKRRQKPGDKASRLAAVPAALPALARAAKLQKRAEGETPSIPETDPELQAGRALWTLADTVSKDGIDPEQALRRYCNAFVDAFDR